MNTLHVSPCGLRGRSHEANRTALDGRGSGNCRRDSQQGGSSRARSESSACVVLPGSRGTRGADLGSAGPGSNGLVSNSLGIHASRCRACSLRRCALGATEAVRHRCRGGGDGIGMLGTTAGAPALDAVRTRTRRAPRVWSWHRKSGSRPAHAETNDLKPWRRLMGRIGALIEEYGSRMYSLLTRYAKPFRFDEPVIDGPPHSPRAGQLEHPLQEILR